MPANPEIPRPPESPQIVEHADQFPETPSMQQAGVQVVQKHFNSQVKDDHGQTLIQTQPTQVITTVTPPADPATLVSQSKGPVSSASTWRATFWLRIIKKAFHFGWQIAGKGDNAQPA